jgi:hypothetical protein
MAGDSKVKNMDHVGNIFFPFFFVYTVCCESGLDFLITASDYLGAEEHTLGQADCFVFLN